MYNAPGSLNELSPELLRTWNEAILAEFNRLEAEYGSRFFAIDPALASGSESAPANWPGHPAEPDFCLGPDLARTLSDWGNRGRHETHNEYCEYRVLYRADAQGRSRPKRVIVTTELREYWMNLAVHSPDRLRELSSEILGFETSMQDLYGTDNPGTLSPEERERAFATMVAGGAGKLEGIPSQPTGPLNLDHILFMTHPINGLDDLLYIVMFGARPYTPANQIGDRASKELIFRSQGVTHLACRHADPAACMAAYGFAFEGRTIAFADPLGMYIQTFSSGVFEFQGGAVPPEWIRFSRGIGDGHHQRLEFGPGDEDDHFLDDIQVEGGPVIGGYQIVERIEVGPYVKFGVATRIEAHEWIPLQGSDELIVCGQASVCERMRLLKREFDAAHGNGLLRVAPRTVA